MKSEIGYYVSKAHNLKDKIIAKEIYLGIHDSISNYDEVTEEEGKTLIQQKEAADTINALEDIDKAVSIASAIPLVINSIPMSNKEALKRKKNFPEWKEDLGEVKQGEKYQLNDKLYMVVQDHTTQANWSPENQSSLWEEVVEDHEGTLEDPIPYNEEMNPLYQGMVLEEGKYYIQGGGAADSVEWNDVLNKPDDIVNITQKLIAKLDVVTYNSEKANFATKEELGNINAILDTINGEVI